MAARFAVEIRELSDDDVAAWAGLLSLSFGRGVDDMRRLWAWFRAGCSVTAWGAWDGDTLVAQYSCLQSALLLPGHPEPFLVGISTNMAVHPAYRGRGLVRDVSRPVYQALETAGALAGVGFSNASGVRVDRHSRGYGYEVVGRMSNRIMCPVAGPGARDIRLTDEWPAGLWREIDSTGPHIQFHTTPEDIRRRYALHPFRRYRYGVLADGDQVLGLVVDRPVRLGPSRGTSLLAVCGADPEKLLRSWVSALSQTGADFIHFLATPHSTVLRILESIGACWSLPYSRSPHYLTVKPLRQEFAPLLRRFDAWDCIGGSIL